MYTCTEVAGYGPDEKFRYLVPCSCLSPSGMILRRLAHFLTLSIIMTTGTVQSSSILDQPGESAG